MKCLIGILAFTLAAPLAFASNNAPKECWVIKTGFDNRKGTFSIPLQNGKGRATFEGVKIVIDYAGSRTIVLDNGAGSFATSVPNENHEPTIFFSGPIIRDVEELSRRMSDRDMFTLNCIWN